MDEGLFNQVTIDNGDRTRSVRVGNNTNPVFVASSSFTARAGEAFPSLTTAASLFTTPGANDKFVRFTIRGGAITVRFDNGTPTAGANGTDLEAGTYEMTATQAQLQNIKAIQKSVPVTGYIEYYT